jgi:Rhs element Vgr protein
MSDFISIEIEGVTADINVISITGNERISNDYGFSLLVNTPINNPLNLQECLKQTITLNYNKQGDTGSTIDAHNGSSSGIITSIQRVFSSNPHSLKFKIECHSPLEILKTVIRSNVFIDYSPVEVISEILNEYLHINFHISCFDSLPKKAFIHQYKESDFNFIGRLCEHWGIHYYFDIDQDNTLIFADDKHYQQSNKTLRFLENPSPEQTFNAVTALNMQESPVINHVIVEGRNPEQDSHIISVEFGDRNIDIPPLKFSGIGIDNEDEAIIIAQRRHELQLCQNVTYTGSSTAQGIKPGFILNIELSGQQDMLELLVLTVNYQVNNLKLASDPNAVEYILHFTAIPADVMFRPKLITPKPTAISSSARVHSSSDSSSLAHRDALGRYKVIFDYIESKRVSHWIRKSQSAAKDNHLDVPLLPDTEVQIAYLGGNPDLPYISCALENSQSTQITSNNQRPYTTSLHTSGILSLEAGRSLSASYRAPMNQLSATNPATIANTVTPTSATATITEYNRLDNNGKALANDERLASDQTDYNVESYQGQVYKVQDTVSFYLGDNPTYYFGQQYREVHMKTPNEKSVKTTNPFTFSNHHFMQDDKTHLNIASSLASDRQVGMVRKLFGNRYNYHNGHIVTVRESDTGPHKTLNYGARYIEHIIDKGNRATDDIAQGFPLNKQPTENDYIVRNHHKQYKINHEETVTVQNGNTYIERIGDTDRVQSGGASKVTITGTTREKSIKISGDSTKKITAANINTTLNTSVLHKVLNGNKRNEIIGSDNSLIVGTKSTLVVGPVETIEALTSSKLIIAAKLETVLGAKVEAIVGPTVKWSLKPELKYGAGKIKKEGFSLSDAEVAINNVKADINATRVSITNALITMIG